MLVLIFLHSNKSDPFSIFRSICLFILDKIVSLLFSQNFEWERANKDVAKLDDYVLKLKKK